MAFQKTISIAKAGIAASYWRIVNIHIDAVDFAARIVLAGYVNANIRESNGQAIDGREYSLTPAQFGALARSEAKGTTTYDAIAGACYDHIAQTRRGIPDGAIFDPETGAITIPATGEIVAAEQVTLDPESKMPVSIPSEFASADSV